MAGRYRFEGRSLSSAEQWTTPPVHGVEEKGAIHRARTKGGDSTTKSVYFVGATQFPNRSADTNQGVTNLAGFPSLFSKHSGFRVVVGKIGVALKKRQALPTIVIMHGVWRLAKYHFNFR